jgi:protein disulfide-isomerase-like protein
MKVAFILVLLFVIGCIADDEPSDVVILTEANFDEKIKEGTWLLEFYAPWCGHCKKLVPTYEKVATELKGKVNVGKVDCTVEKSIGSRFGIRGFPTLKLLADGQLYDYKGDRSQAHLVSFSTGDYSKETPSPVPAAAAAPAQAQTEEKKAAPVPPTPAATENAGPSDVVILTESNFDDLTSKGDWLLEFYAPWCGHCKKLAPTYDKVATKLKGQVNVGKVDCTEQTSIGKRFGIRGYPTLKFLHEATLRDYKGDRSEDDLVKFSLTGWKDVEGVAVPGKPSPAN